MEEKQQEDSNNIENNKDNSNEPKDLSMKTKKLKHIPPPLNLSTNKSDASNFLKDFALIATSPKSPLMQKNLPFRKRAHSFSGVNDKGTNNANNSNNGESSSSSPTSTTGGTTKSTITTKTSNEEVTSTTPTTITKQEKIPIQIHQQIQHQYIRPPVIMPTNPFSLIDTSALLSPAPSSLGSSQEELNYSPHWSTPSISPRNTVPWPRCVWHCFLPGCRIRIDQVQGGIWQSIEELAVNRSAWYPELLLPLQLDAQHLIRDEHKVSLQFSYISMAPPRVSRPWEGGVVVECELYHPFYVIEKGWCAPYPEMATQKYGYLFKALERGDTCQAPNSVPLISPDICDRFKRFSFPPEEPSGSNNVFQPVNLMPPPSSPSLASPPESLLSPPSSPTKKALDAMRPKRPMNAFMLFAKRYRLDLIQKYPGKDNRAISVLLGEAWKSLDPENRNVYVQEAKVMALEQKRLHPDCWKRKRSHSTS